MSPIRYRRGSVFWALILIAIGVIFLLQNFYPTVHPWDIVARYWPVLIIIWGISKLVDYLQFHAHPEIAAPRFFSGTDVLLLILILVCGTIVSHLVLAPWHQWREEWGIHVGDGGWGNPFLSSYTFNQNLSQPVSGKTHLVVVDRRGDVQVAGSDASGISAVVKETIRAGNAGDAQKTSQSLPLHIVEQNGSYVLHPDFDSLPDGGRNVRLDLTLQVPRATSLEITIGNGDVLLSDLRGNQTVTSSDGAVHVTGIKGSVQVQKAGGSAVIRSIKGEVRVGGRGGDVEISQVSGPVTVDGEFSGLVRFEQLPQGVEFASSRTRLKAQKLPGKLEMQMGSLEAADVYGPLELSTRHKDIDIAQFRDAVTITDEGGNILLASAGAPTQPIVVNSKNGDIELALPPSSSFVMNAMSRSGQVACDFSSSSLVVQSQGSEPSIKGSYGKGGPPIHLFTTYGTVHLVRQMPSGSKPSSVPSEQTELRWPRPSSAFELRAARPRRAGPQQLAMSF